MEAISVVNVRNPVIARASRRRKLVFVVVLCGAILGAGELAARLRLTMGGRDHQVMYAWHRKHRLSGAWVEQDREHPYLPYYPKVKAPDIEMPGLRLAGSDAVKPPDVFRIFCLGGSTTYYGYPSKLQAALESDFSTRGLRLEVVNAADVSWTSAESLINFSLRCLPYEPDAVIVYHAVNDCWPAFGEEWRPDYSHWRRRLIDRRALWWDHLPGVLDRSAAFVHVRSWFEIPARYAGWKRAMMQYVPDFETDTYHGVDPYRRNISSIVAIAQANDIPVLLSTQVYNADEPRKRLVDAIRDVNLITCELAEKYPGVTLIDAAKTIAGSDELMMDICHFRRDRDGEDQLVELFAATFRERLADFLGSGRTLASK